MHAKDNQARVSRLEEKGVVCKNLLEARARKRFVQVNHGLKN
jgi:hypothetical protein